MSFTLSDTDRQSMIWRRLSAHLESRLAQACAQLERMDRTEPQTAALRGEIRCLRGLIALGTDPPALTGDLATPQGLAMMTELIG